jgi:hypothetical protein
VEWPRPLLERQTWDIPLWLLLCTARLFTPWKLLTDHEFKQRDDELINDMWTTRLEMLYMIPGRRMLNHILKSHPPKETDDEVKHITSRQLKWRNLHMG